MAEIAFNEMCLNVLISKIIFLFIKHIQPQVNKEFFTLKCIQQENDM